MKFEQFKKILPNCPKCGTELIDIKKMYHNYGCTDICSYISIRCCDDLEQFSFIHILDENNEDCYSWGPNQIYCKIYGTSENIVIDNINLNTIIKIIKEPKLIKKYLKCNEKHKRRNRKIT